MAAAVEAQGDGDELWELCKENVLPVKQGRNIDDITQRLQRGPSRKRELEEEKARFETRILEADAVDEDPLQVWVRYLNWLQKEYPSDNFEVFRLLERCTLHFKDCERYKNDVRYLKFWLFYADHLQDPGDIYKYLHRNKIGSELSLFWVAWAWNAEKRGNFPLAEKVLTKGIQLEAQPIETLKLRYQQFCRRMSRYWLNQNQEDDLEGAPGPAPQVGRRALNSQRSRSRSTTVNGVRQQGGGVVGVTRAQMPTDTYRNRPAQVPSAGAQGFSIFNDEEDQELDVNSGRTGEWKTLGSQKEVRKENEMAPTRWNDGPLHPPGPKHRRGGHAPQPSGSIARHPLSSQQPGVAIFVDEEFRHEEKPYPHHLDKKPSNPHVLSVRNQMDVPAREGLSKDPLMNFQSPVKPSKDPMNISKDGVPATKEKEHNTAAVTTADHKPTSKSPTLAMDMNLLKDEEGRECQFEEARARKYAAKRASNGARTNGNDLSPGVDSRASPAPQSSLPSAATKQDEREDLTINTRVALSDLISMFASPTAERGGGSDNKVMSSGRKMDSQDRQERRSFTRPKSSEGIEGGGRAELATAQAQEPPTRKNRAALRPLADKSLAPLGGASTTSIQIFHDDEDEEPISNSMRRGLGERPSAPSSFLPFSVFCDEPEDVNPVTGGPGSNDYQAGFSIYEDTVESCVQPPTCTSASPRDRFSNFSFDISPFKEETTSSPPPTRPSREEFNPRKGSRLMSGAFPGDLSEIVEVSREEDELTFSSARRGGSRR